jgi:hypothetical protein
MDTIQRDMNFQTVGWFWDIYKRQLLIMDPPYQRRSVWNQDYMDYFVDTVLHGYPAPALFLFRETTSGGVSKYSVVDGKQRLATLFEFATNRFPVSEKTTLATIARFRGKYFKDLPDDVKASFWNYRFAVEYLPSDNEEIINNIFDRINRNVAKLTPQELRHAKFSGEFITKVQELSGWMFGKLPQGIPNLPLQSRKQMKDDEFVSQLLLLIEEGPRSYFQDDLDQAYADRDQNWEHKDSTSTRFQEIISYLAELANTTKDYDIFKSRLRYQEDFYSLFGAINNLIETDRLSHIEGPAAKLESFIKIVDNPEKRLQMGTANQYFEAARSAVSDAEPRQFRINAITSVLLGEIQIE